MKPILNFHLDSDLYLRRFEADPEALHIMRAKNDDDEGQSIARFSLSVFASLVCSLCPAGEADCRFDYVSDFLRTGEIHCGGCGCRMKQGESVGRLNIVNAHACQTCYEQKFKPLFDEVRLRTECPF